MAQASSENLLLLDPASRLGASSASCCLAISLTRHGRRNERVCSQLLLLQRSSSCGAGRCSYVVLPPPRIERSQSALSREQQMLPAIVTENLRSYPLLYRHILSRMPALHFSPGGNAARRWARTAKYDRLSSLRARGVDSGAGRPSLRPTVDPGWVATHLMTLASLTGTSILC